MLSLKKITSKTVTAHFALGFFLFFTCQWILKCFKRDNGASENNPISDICSRMQIDGHDTFVEITKVDVFLRGKLHCELQRDYGVLLEQVKEDDFKKKKKL